MARKNYIDDFRRRTVDLCESTPGAMLKGMAVDLGISRGASKQWVDRLGPGTATADAWTVPTVGRPETSTTAYPQCSASITSVSRE